MNTTKLHTSNRYGVLLCKYGSLGHGPLDIMLSELERVWKGRESELEIIEYDYQTHDFDGTKVVPRDEPLRFYSPQELYAHAPVRVEYDLFRWIDLFQQDLPHYVENHISTIEVRVLFDEFVDGYHHMLATFWYEDKPFMIGQLYSSGEDSIPADLNKFITDPGQYWEAILEMIELNRPEIEVCDPEQTLVQLTNFGYRTIIL